MFSIPASGALARTTDSAAPRSRPSSASSAQPCSPSRPPARTELSFACSSPASRPARVDKHIISPAMLAAHAYPTVAARLCEGQKRSDADLRARYVAMSGLSALWSDETGSQTPVTSDRQLGELRQEALAAKRLLNRFLRRDGGSSSGLVSPLYVCFTGSTSSTAAAPTPPWAVPARTPPAQRRR